MNKQEAIRWYKAIQNGEGVDRYNILNTLKRGSLAQDLWEDSDFTLGIEYGVLIALINVFHLTQEDIRSV